MFTGIVETVGKVEKKNNSTLVVRPIQPFTPEKGEGVKIGESISVEGVCLTVDQVQGQKITFKLLPETVRVSTLRSLKTGDSVNLERSLRVGDRLGGHLLLGHVDARAVLKKRVKRGKNQTLEIELSKDLQKQLVPKGPIGVDGISLTLDSKLPSPVKGEGKRKGVVRIHLIPHTALATTLGSKPVGAFVNIEVDLVSKYLQRML